MSKTRTKRTNGRSPLKLSTLRSDRYNVRPGERRQIACLDCDVWHWIDGETVLKVREHDDKESGQRCPGSLQVVTVDIDVARWQKQQDRRRNPDALMAESRRPSRVLRKPKVPVSPPVHTMGRAALPDSDALDLSGLDALRQLLLILNEPERALAEEEAAKAARGRRPQEWEQVLPAVERADQQRLKELTEAKVNELLVDPIFAPTVPSETLHPSV
ncbi:hypothetical protein [Streptacidiphilus carbonis]|uniref:hypothetical protein n=1 Tax=Streptacidiphilus carbonis TaxID=105422 RepID=UPI000694576F|nr:hypothetical protein [Streptacidiphilus carbonis]